MLSEEEIKEVEKAKSNILRGNDIESAALILEKVIWGNLIIVGGRVNITKVAVRQILNFIEEYKDKGYLDVVREKVKANEERTKLQKEVEHQKEKRENQKTELAILNEKQKEMNKLINTVKSYKGMFKKQEKEIKKLQKENEKKDEIIKSKDRLIAIVGKELNEAEKENKEKDKQIDLMAEQLTTAINSKNGTINALQCALKERTEERDRKDDIVTNQNKILDLMTETIRKLAIALANYKGSYDKETINLTSNTEEIKQYFERKSNEI